jgi:hypothetical protein
MQDYIIANLHVGEQGQRDLLADAAEIDDRRVTGADFYDFDW